MSKSSMIRSLYETTDLTVRQIANEVGVRYQFAYNVIRQLTDKRGEEVRKSPIVFGSPEAIQLAQAAAAAKREEREAERMITRIEGSGAITPTGRSDFSKRNHVSVTPPRIPKIAPGVLKSSDITELLEGGFKPDEIATAFNLNVSFVNNVARLLKLKQRGGAS